MLLVAEHVGRGGGRIPEVQHHRINGTLSQQAFKMYLYSSKSGGHALSTRQATAGRPLSSAAAAHRLLPRRVVPCTASSSADASTNETSEAPRPRISRRKLFTAPGSSEYAAAAAAEASPPGQQPAAAVPVAEEIRRSFEKLGFRKVGVSRLSGVSITQTGVLAGSGHAMSAIMFTKYATKHSPLPHVGSTSMHCDCLAGSCPAFLQLGVLLSK